MNTNKKIANRIGKFVVTTYNDVLCLGKEEAFWKEVKLRKYITEKVLNNDYAGAFIYLNKPQRIPAYTSIFNLIPDSQKYELFLEVYPLSGYGIVKPAIVEKLYELRPRELIIATLKEKADNTGYITVYRGENSGSTDIKKALSWTLNHNIAELFVKQMNTSGLGYVYTAKAHIGDVIAYVNDREEEEVLLRYKDVEIITKKKWPH